MSITFVVAGALICRWAETYWSLHPWQFKIYVAGCAVVAVGLGLAVAGR